MLTASTLRRRVKSRSKYLLGNYSSPIMNGSSERPRSGLVGWVGPLVMFSSDSKFLYGQRDLLEIAEFLFGQRSTSSEGNECQAFRIAWCPELHGYTEHTRQATTDCPRWKIPAFIKIFEHLLDMRFDGQIKSKYMVDSSVVRRSTGRLIMPKSQNTIMSHPTRASS